MFRNVRSRFDKRVIRPLKQCLPLPPSTFQISFCTSFSDCPDMTGKGPPPSNLYGIQFRNSTAQPISTIPLKPSAFIWISLRVCEDTPHAGCPSRSRTRRGPSVLSPNPQGLTGLDLKIVTGYIRRFGREFFHGERHAKPFLWEFVGTVVEIFAFEHSHCKHLARREGGAKSRIHILARIGFQSICVVTNQTHGSTALYNRSFLILAQWLPFLDASKHI